MYLLYLGGQGILSWSLVPVSVSNSNILLYFFLCKGMDETMNT